MEHNRGNKLLIIKNKPKSPKSWRRCSGGSECGSVCRPFHYHLGGFIFYGMDPAVNRHMVSEVLFMQTQWLLSERPGSGPSELLRSTKTWTWSHLLRSSLTAVPGLWGHDESQLHGSSEPHGPHWS